MEAQPYFCPNCRSNRIKFRLLTTYAESLLKDAVTGEVRESGKPELVQESDPVIQCVVCGFAGRELRFVKQAEREPRAAAAAASSYLH